MSGYQQSLYVDDFGKDSLDRVQHILAGVPGGFHKAVGSALARAAAAGKTQAAKIVTQEYAINQSTFRNNVKNINHVQKSGTELSIVFGFKGYVIPLISFDVSYGSDGRVSARVKRDAAKKRLDHVFVAQMGGHTGLYERTGTSRFPIEQKYGPSTAHMFMNNEAVTDKMTETVISTYEKRIEHEITRILNGIGG